jgi:hypothetical protein
MTKRKKYKQWYTKHYTDNKRSSNTNPTRNHWWTQVLRKGRQFMLHM